jgi:hypothetical protein
MRFFLLLQIWLGVSFSACAQINLEDSTVQVIGFWNKGEKQNYSVLLEKFKTKDNDTTSRERTLYDVEVTVKDSTANSYLVEWHYKNYQIETDNQFTKKLIALAEDIKVVIKTDELGAIVEVVNWEEVRDYIKKATAQLKKEFKDIPKINEIVSQVEATFSTRQSVESAAIADAQQFYTFHGAKYNLGEVLTAQIKVPNLVGPEPFDSDITAYLDEINADDNNYIMRSTQAVNSEQLTEATYHYLVKMSNGMGVSPPKREDIKPLTNETFIASRIHGSGWVIYSIQTKTVTSDNVTNVEERTIEIK